MVIIVVPVIAYDKCWFFGDSFCKSLFEQYFQNRLSTEYNGYIKANFDVRGFFGNFMSDNPSTISRIANLMANAVSSQINNKIQPLPKIIVVVPDGDLIQNFLNRHSVSKPFSRIINYIMTEHERSVAAFCEYLPAKCLCKDYPQILWIEVPLHDIFKDNSQHSKFNKCLQETAKLHNNVSTLMFKKVWDPKDSQLFLHDARHFSAQGLWSYWEAID